MSFSIDHERSRINQIISKFSCNYTSPVSLARQSLNKMTRHRKGFSHEFESIKDQDSTMPSVKLILEESLNRISQVPQNNQPTPSHHSSQQVFTFQTLREAIAANPDLIYKKSLNSSAIDKSSKAIKVKNKSKKRGEEEKLALPSIKKAKLAQKDEEFFNIISHRIVNHLQSNLLPYSKFLKQSENDGRDNLYGETQGQKEIRVFDRKLKGFMPGVIHKVRKGFVNEVSKKNSKILHVVLPKYRKNSYFIESRVQNKNFSDEDTSVKGWDKMTPFDLLDPV